MKDKRTICKQCNKVFYTFQSENRLFCCNDCYLKYKRENANVEKLICLECGKKFTARKDFHQKFCSKQCSSLYRFKQHNIYKICEYCGKEFRVSKCHIDRKYCSKKCQGKTYKTTRSGKNGYNYNPLLTEQDRIDRRYDIRHKEWSLNVKKKDNFICQKCGDSSGHNLVSHHILAYWKYPNSRYDIDNGITLCSNCHKEFHKLYGNKKFTDKDLYNFLGRY